MKLIGLLDTWDRTDALGRRELLAALFVALDVRHGMIWRGRPQPDVAVELLAHLEHLRFGWQANTEIGSVGVAQAGRYSNNLDQLDKRLDGRSTKL
jgi:hypothetical protein